MSKPLTDSVYLTICIKSLPLYLYPIKKTNDMDYWYWSTDKRLLTGQIRGLIGPQLRTHHLFLSCCTLVSGTLRYHFHYHFKTTGCCLGMWLWPLFSLLLDVVFKDTADIENIINQAIFLDVNLSPGFKPIISTEDLGSEQQLQLRTARSCSQYFFSRNLEEGSQPCGGMPKGWRVYYYVIYCIS